MSKFLTDFKEFALKGNVIDLAVGVIVGGAFGKIVASLVDDIIMPLVSLAIPGTDGYRNWKYIVTEGHEATADGAAAVEEIAINYGTFLQNIVDFFIIAISIFVALRIVMKLKKKEAEPAPEPEKPTPEVELLTEIRDLLKKDDTQK